MTSTTPPDGASFDVDAWLTEAKPPQRAVILYARSDLLSRVQELEAAIEAEMPGDTRMGGSPARAEIAALKHQIEASKLTFHVRAPMQHERQAIARRTRKPDAPDLTPDESNLFEARDGTPYVDEAKYAAELFALVCVQPSLTVDQAAKMIDRIGPQQTHQLNQAILRAEGEPIDVPLSRIDSGTIQDS